MAASSGKKKAKQFWSVAVRIDNSGKADEKKVSAPTKGKAQRLGTVTAQA